MIIKDNIPPLLLSLIIPSLVLGPFFPNLLLTIVSSIILYKIIKEKKFSYLTNKYFIIFCVWCFYLILNSLFSKTPLNSLESSLFYFRFGLFSLATLYILQNYKLAFKYFFYIAITTMAIVFLDSLFQYFNKYNLFNFYNFNNINELRLSGLFRDELILGSFFTRLYPLIVFLIFYLFNNKIKTSFFLFIVLSLFTCIISLISGERVSVFYFFFSFLLILFIFAKKNILKSLFFSFIIFFGSVFLILSNNNLKNRLIDKTLDDFDIFRADTFVIIPKSHNLYYSTALEIFYENKFFGIGSKNYRVECKSKKYQSGSCNTHPHQTYLQLLAETGVIGTIPVIFLFFYFSYVLFSGLIKINFKNNFDPLNRYKIILSISFLISLMPLIPTGSFFSSWLSILYYLPLGFYIFLLNFKTK